MTKVRVVAAKGLRVPRHDNARRYISDSAEEEVDINDYYRRRLMDGDLIEVLPDMPKSKKKLDEVAEQIATDHPWQTVPSLKEEA